MLYQDRFRRRCSLATGIAAVAAAAILLPSKLGPLAAQTQRVGEGTAGPEHPAVAALRTDELEQTVRDELKQTGTPGAVVAIVQGDKVVYARGFGIASVATRQPVTPAMLFPVASLTKMYTAAALLTLLEEKGISPKTAIGTYLPTARTTPRLAAVTYHQLLSHTAGLPSDGTHFSLFPTFDPQGLARQVESLTDRVFFADPGTAFSYSNTGYVIAGYLIERMTGQSYTAVIQKRLLTPLGMRHATFDPTAAASVPVAQSHVGDAGEPATVQQEPMRFSATSPSAGGLYASVMDLSRFAIAFMNEGRIDHRAVLSPAVVRRMRTPAAPVLSQSLGASYGYGLMVRNYRGVRLVEHGGTLAGSTSDFVMAPDQHVAVIVLTNRGAHLTKVVDQALEAALPLTPEKERTPRASAAATLSPADAEAYLGDYAQNPDDPNWRIRIVRADGGKGIALEARKMRFPLAHVKNERFTIVLPGFTSPSPVAFVRGKDGQIAYFHIRLRAYRRMP